MAHDKRFAAGEGSRNGSGGSALDPQARSNPNLAKPSHLPMTWLACSSKIDRRNKRQRRRHEGTNSLLLKLLDYLASQPGGVVSVWHSILSLIFL
jgi:hypothetical protein